MVLIERRPPPDPTRMRPVAPEVVVKAVPAPARIGNALVGIEHLPDLRPQTGERLIAGQRRDCLRVAVPYPPGGVRIIKFLQPEVRVIALIGQPRHPRNYPDG